MGISFLGGREIIFRSLYQSFLGQTHMDVCGLRTLESRSQLSLRLERQSVKVCELISVLTHWNLVRANVALAVVETTASRS